MSDDFIEVMAAPNQVCEHVHLPVQSGSDRILAAMNRRLRPPALPGPGRAASPTPCRTSLSPPTSSSAFPGRPRRTSSQTLSLVEECRFDGAFTFIYSPRRRHRGRGAARARWPPAVAEERMTRLVELVQRLGRERNQALVGQTVEVMVERASRQRAGEVMGRTRGHKPVNFAVGRRAGRPGAGGAARSHVHELPRAAG